MNGAPLVAGTLLPESFAREAAARDRDADDGRRQRAHRALGRWWTRTAATHGPASSPRALFEGAGAPLLRLLGFAPQPVSLRASADQAAVVTCTRRGTRVAALTIPWNARPGEPWRSAVAAGTRLGSPWCLVFDGTSIGAVDAARPFTRRHLAVSLPAAAGDPRDFAVLWSLLRAERFDEVTGSSAFKQLVQQSDRHRALTCAALDRGVREAHDRLLGALTRAAHRRSAPGDPAVREQALTLVFRLLFLLYAESRGLLPLDHPIYRDGYSMAALGRAIDGPARGGLWLALRALMRMAHAGCRVRDLDVTAFNGRLFSPDRAPLAEQGRLDEEAVRASLSALTWRSSGGRRVAVPYAELGVEQLGAIYERLIDEPPEPASPRRAARASAARKSTGTFYTPEPLTHFVVRRTLAPLVEAASPDGVLRLRVLDPAMGSGAFLVAACRYLAVAYERALVRHGQARPGDLDETDRARFRRLVAQQCLFGVDNNPTAVQLARLSLWLTTLARDRPLTFLDHRLRVGDSLVGADLSRLARPAGPARRRVPGALPLLAALDPSASLRDGVTGRLALAATPDDDAATVREKERALARLQGPDGPLHRWRVAADAWCAAWFWPGPRPPSPQVTADLVASALREAGGLPASQRDPLLANARLAAERQAFFHWPFEFPEVFSDAEGHPRHDGGFDAIIGNPPWDMVRAEDGATRDAARQLVAFARDSGLFSPPQQGHVNRYQLFVERSIDLLRDGGRLGLIVPWGLFGDAASARVRRRLIEKAAVDAVVAFDNRRALFPIHRSVRFAACCATRGAPTRAIACRMGETEASALEAIPDTGGDARHFPIAITREAVTALGGELAAVPAVRDAAALALLLRLAARHLPVADPRGWGARFGRELNATDDRGRFARRAPGDAWGHLQAPLPVVEGKHLAPFVADVDAAGWQLPRSRATAARLRRFDRPRLAFRDVASPGNRLTLIAAVLPAGTASTHTVSCLETPMAEEDQHVLCALLNSLVANWYVRHWVSTHVTAGLVSRLPVPWLRRDDAQYRRLLQLSRRCAGEGTEGDGWVELQADTSRAYGLSAGELGGVLESFPLIDPGCRARIARRFGATHAP